MSDQIETGFQPAQDGGQPSEKLSNEPQVGGQPDYVTRQELEQFRSSLEQSLTDRAVSRIENRLGKWKKNLEQQGVTVTPAMLDQGRQELALSELHQLVDEDVAAQPVRQSTQSPFTPDAKAKVQARLAQLQADYGIKLEPGTELYDNLPWLNPNADKFLAKAEDEFKREVARRNEPTLTPNPARSPLPSGGAPSGDLYSQYKTEVDRAMTRDERLNIRNKYRERGLEI